MAQLLEREQDILVLRAAAEGAAAGHGSVVLVAGEAGIGKSSLVSEWVREPAPGHRVLQGWCDDLQTSKTLGPFWDIARGFKPLAEPVEQADTRRVIDVLLRELSYPLQATLLVLEDLHWADEATLDVVRYVGRRIARLPAVLALTYRDDELEPDHPLRRVLGALPPASLRRVQPRPLSRAAVAAMAAPSGRDPDEILRVTGGNPFFVTEVVGGAAAEATLPPSVTDAVLDRVRPLPTAVREALGLLSVLPGAPDLDLVRRLFGDLRLLATAEQRGILVVESSSVRFRHELTRRAVLGLLPASTRASHNGCVLDVLLDADADPTALVGHAVEAGRADVVASHGPRAATTAYVAGAHREAVRHHAAVLRHADLLEPPELARLLEEHAWALYNLVRFGEAEAAARRAVALRERLGEPGPLARALVTHSRMLYMASDVDGALLAQERAAAVIEGVDGAGAEAVHAEVLTNRVALLNLTDRHAAVVEEAPGVVEVLERLDRPDLLVIVHQYAGWSQVHLGDQGGVACIREAIVLGREAAGVRRDARSLEPLARAYTNAIEILTELREWKELDVLLDEALGFYDDHEFAAHRYDPLANRGRMLLYRGAWQEAAGILEETHASVANAGILETFALAPRALLAVRSGDSRAEALVGRVWNLAASSASGQYVVPAALPYLEWCWLTGQQELDQALIVQVVEVARGTILHGTVLWRLALLGLPPASGAAGGPEILEPERSSLAGDWAGAAEGWRRLDMPYERGVELLRGGEVEPVTEALGIFLELGAEPAARLARRRLRELGARVIPRGPASATRRNPAGLTARQVEVLRLLAKGWTNAEIADRLVLSVRTVDHHVSAVLDKLEVPTRKAAAQRAAELGLD